MGIQTLTLKGKVRSVSNRPTAQRPSLWRRGPGTSKSSGSLTVLFQRRAKRTDALLKCPRLLLLPSKTALLELTSSWRDLKNEA